jgi:phage terminase large subunit
MSAVEFQVSRVYDEMMAGADAGKTLFVLEGGARSTKTSSGVQFIDTKVIENLPKKIGLDILILRDTLISAKHTTIKDFFKINDLYSIPVSPEMNIGRAIQQYDVFGSHILFEGCDNYEKFLGSEYDIVWINEAMNISYQVYRNLRDRCRMFMILDYNPNRTEHWIYDKVIPSPDCCYIHSTMLDNPFLDPNIRKSILSSEPTPANIAAGTSDPIHWKIFGLGLRAEMKGLIYTNVNYVDAFPDQCSWVVYGLDFGFSQSPTGVLKVGFKDGELWWQEMVYEVGLTNLPPRGDEGDHTKNIAYKLNAAGIKKSDKIIADNAEAKSIAELQQDGWFIIGVKGKDVNGMIGINKRYKINVVRSSVNLVKEVSNYKWVESEASPNWTEEDNLKKNQPVKAFDHLLDGAGYVALMELRGTVQRSRSTLISVR